MIGLLAAARSAHPRPFASSAWAEGERAVEGFIASGRIVEAILAIVVVEAIAAAVYLARNGRRISGLLANSAAGACLLLAVRAALIGAGWGTVALWLALSLPAHLIDLWRRLRD
jgi:hypothetical protein